jgi:hypothetical protein
LGQLFKALAAGNGCFQRRDILGGDALAHILSLIPNLVLKIRAGATAASSGAVLGFKGAIFHRLALGHLFEKLFASGLKSLH